MSGADKLIYAILSENIGKLAELLETLDLDEVNGKNKKGETALHIACRRKYNEAVDLLVAKVGVDVNAKNKNNCGWTPLHVAAENNNNHAVTKILTNPQVDVNVQNNGGWTPLHWACYCNHPQIVSELLASPGVNVNIQDNLGLTPLHRACFQNHPQTLSELLRCPGIDVNVKDSDGRTPLHWACFQNHHQIVSELLRCPGVDVNVRDRDCDTPLMVLARECYEETLKLLLEDSRVDIDVKDKEGGGLEDQVGRGWGHFKTKKQKQKCLELISNERRKRENSKVEKGQQSRDGNVGQAIDKIEKLNQEMADLEEKIKAKLDIGKQKKKDLNERQSSEKKTMAKKHREDEAALRKKQKDEEITLKKKHEEEEMTLKKHQNDEEATLKKKHEEEATGLETSLAREDEVEQHHMAILREFRDELALNVQKLPIDPAQDTSGDRGKVEAAQKSLECPICFELMKPPTRIWMCRLSHLICDTCKDRVDRKDDNRGICPTCMTERANLRATMAENFSRATFDE